MATECCVGDLVQVVPLDYRMSEEVAGGWGRVSAIFTRPFGLYVDMDDGERIAVGREAIHATSRATSELDRAGG